MHPLLAKEMARLHAADLARSAARASGRRRSQASRRPRAPGVIAQLLAALGGSA